MNDRDAKRREFSERVESQLDALYGVALRLTRNPTDAEDLVSESIAKAWYAIDSLEEWSSFRGWIFRIMKNHFYSGHRKSSKQPEVIGLDELGGESSDGEDVATMLVRQSDDFLQWWADPEKEVADKLLGEQVIVFFSSRKARISSR